jgi:hypothetical protein
MSAAALVVPTYAPSGALLGVMAANTPVLEIQTSPTDYLCITRISFTNPADQVAATTQSSVAVGFSAAAGVGVIRQGAFVYDDSGNTNVSCNAVIYTSYTDHSANVIDGASVRHFRTPSIPE